jgi:hypothetical protein
VPAGWEKRQTPIFLIPEYHHILSQYTLQTKQGEMLTHHTWGGPAGRGAPPPLLFVRNRRYFHEKMMALIFRHPHERR